MADTVSGAVLWLHGLGDTSDGWSFLQQEVKPSAKVEWVFPTAPTAPVSCNGGMSMTSWFDMDRIPVTPDGSHAHEDDVLHTVSKIHGMLDDIQKKHPDLASDKIFVGGFSQGGAISTLAGLSYPRKLGGVVNFSGWVPLSESSAEGRVLHQAAFWWPFCRIGDRDQNWDGGNFPEFAVGVRRLGLALVASAPRFAWFSWPTPQRFVQRQSAYDMNICIFTLSTAISSGPTACHIIS